MFFMRLIPLSVFLFFLGSGCAIGPILSHDVGRSVGDGNHDIQLLSTTEGFWGFKYEYGLTKNLDLGIQWEALSAGLRLKYSILNNPTAGFSFGTSVGAGSSFGGSYYHATLTGSYKTKVFEPFASVRYTKVQSDEKDLRDADTGDLFLTIPKFDYSYGQVFVGTKIWAADWFALSLEATSFFVSGDDVKFSDGALFSLGLEFAF
jgi:hypothetical protein